MKILPVWTRGIISIPLGLFWIYMGNILSGWEEPVSGIGVGFFIIGFLLLVVAVPTIYYDVMVLLITGRKQRQVTQALTGQRDPFYRSMLFATGLFLIFLGQALRFVVNSLDEKMIELVGWIAVDIASMVGWGLTILGLALAGYRLIFWLIKKFMHRSTVAQPMQPVRQAVSQFQSQHDPFRDIQGYDD